MKHWILALALATPAFAGKTKDTTKSGAATGAHAVRDSFRTFGRSTRSLFTHGPHAAKQTWKANAHHTRAHARMHASETRHDARR